MQVLLGFGLWSSCIVFWMVMSGSVSEAIVFLFWIEVFWSLMKFQLCQVVSEFGLCYIYLSIWKYYWLCRYSAPEAAAVVVLCSDWSMYSCNHFDCKCLFWSSLTVCSRLFWSIQVEGIFRAKKYRECIRVSTKLRISKFFKLFEIVQN